MTEKDFISVFKDKHIWKRIKKTSIFPYRDLPEKDLDIKGYLRKLYKKLEKRTYNPSAPLEYLTLNKGNGVLRVVPVLNLDDLLVYYYCARKLEKFIARNRTNTTFGGFGLSGKLKRLEEKELSSAIASTKRPVLFLDDEYGYFVKYIFGPRRWFDEWGDYNHKLYLCCLKNREGYAAQADISNFYDSISLDSLEYKLRKVTDHRLNEVVYLLMHFLRYWNRHSYFYRQQGVGLPQDLLGEASRILANHFLQDYDKKISSFCKKMKAQYFRYADDQTFLADSKDTLEVIVAKASSLLMKEGLNFNQKKVKVQTVRKMKFSFAFNSFKALECKPHTASTISNSTIQKQIAFYLRNHRVLRKEGYSLLSRILTVINWKDHRKLRLAKLKKYILSRSYLYRNYLLNSKDLCKIYSILNSKEKRLFLRLLKLNIKECIYSYYLFEIKHFSKKEGLSVRYVNTRITIIRNLYNLGKN